MPMHSKQDLDRRAMLAATAASGAALLLPTNKLLATELAQPSNRIKDENARQGTRKWMLENTRIDPATKYRCPWIEGYISPRKHPAR